MWLQLSWYDGDDYGGGDDDGGNDSEANASIYAQKLWASISQIKWNIMALLGFPLGHRPDSKAEKVRKSASKEKIKDSGKGKEKVSGTKPYKPYGHLLFVCLFVPLLLLYVFGFCKISVHISCWFLRSMMFLFKACILWLNQSIPFQNICLTDSLKSMHIEGLWF